MGIAKDMSHGVQDNNFTVTGADQLGVNIEPADLMDACLAENDRRLGVYDQRLLRPRFVPAIVRFARRLMRQPKKKTRS
jgi:hypothetical protein